VGDQWEYGRVRSGNAHSVNGVRLHYVEERALVAGGHLIDPAAPEVLAFVEEVLALPAAQ
jgi:hypothetical protein